MTEPILNPEYWRKRLIEARKEQIHTSIFRCGYERWLEIEQVHKRILSEVVGKDMSILDVGCGYGRLLTLMPRHWKGIYWGVDLSEDFVHLARQTYPDRDFFVGEILTFNPTLKFDLAILISIRPMIIRNLGQEYWDTVESHLRQHVTQILYLEYDPEAKGSLE